MDEAFSKSSDNNDLSLETNDLDVRSETGDLNIVDESQIGYREEASPPEIKILKEDDQGLIISFSLSDIIVEKVEDPSGEIYQKISIKEGGHLADVGNPELPMKALYLDVPNSVELDVVVKKSTYVEENGYNIFPFQESIAECDDRELSVEKNTTFYEVNQFFPNKIVELQDVGIIRGHRTALLIVCPVIYNPVTKILRVYNELEIDIKYLSRENNEKEKTQYFDDMARYDSEEYASFFESIYLNYDSSIDRDWSLAPQIDADGADYLIIAPDNFYEELIPLAQHKSDKGLLTEIVNLSDISVNPSADDIADYIQDAYDTWSPAPTYLLLVGDSELLPPHYKTIHPYHGTLTATDLYYATLDGSDYFPDVFMGRLPVKTEAELNVVVDKIINYEQNFNQNDPWRKNITMAAYEQSGRFFIDTCENISSFLDTLDYDITKIYNGYPYTGTTQDVINAINYGTFLVNHRDHGDWNGWSNPSFTVSDIDELNNGDKLPVMFSMNCLSGRFDYTQDCFTETILKAENKGVVGVIGSTRVSYSGYNDELDKGFIAAIWPEYQSSYDNNVGKSAKLGHILNFGKMYMYDKYYLTGGAGYPWTPSEIATLTEFEMFTLFGDPELSMFKVDHDLEVSLEIPTDPVISETYTINATVFNSGIEDMSDIELYLYCDNSIVEDIDIPILMAGDNETINYDWTPQQYGSFNFTAIVPPKPEEFYLSNNRVTKFAIVKRDLSVDLEVPFKTYLDKSYLINATITNEGPDPENSVYFYLIINDEIKNSTCIPTLQFEEIYTLTYNWTPVDFGSYNITCKTPLRLYEINTINNVIQEFRNINPIIFRDDFEHGLANWESVEDLWHFTSIYSPWPDPCYSPNYAMWFGREVSGNFQTGYRVYGSIISKAINLSDVSTAYLNFYHWFDGESYMSWDNGYVFISVNGIDWDQIYRVYSPCEPWENVEVNISDYCGYETVYLRFYFNSGDGLYNNYRGWLIDDVEIYTDDYSYQQKNLECPPHPPTLTDEDVDPNIFHQDTLITFSVNYADFDNDAPSQINVVINGTPYAMSKLHDYDHDYTDGCVYEYYTTLSPSFYCYEVYFNCSDGKYSVDTIVYDGLRVHFKPTLTNESVTPKIGYADTLITFTVNYTDIENNAPSNVYVIVNSIPYEMNKQDELDDDYTDGCIYEVSLYLNPKQGNYSYYFWCSNEFVSSATSNIHDDLKIHSKPTLTNENVLPLTGYPDTLFTFSVNYTDLDNDAPSQINLIINGTPYTMVKQNSNDNYYADGCIYVNSTNLPLALYDYIYYFNCSDGIHFYTTNEYNLRVHSKPTLTNESISPKIGYADTLITFKVNYTDLDNEAPIYSYLIVLPDTWMYSMDKQDELDNDYTDGCIYVVSIYLIPKEGNYSYYFLFSDDGVNLISSNTYDDLRIHSKPNLTNPYLWRSIGYPDTNFGFWVTYTDLDNDTPLQINVIINGTSHSMNKQYPNDDDYSDGCLYRYSTTLALAMYNYTYYFNCTDGEHTYTTSVFNNIKVHNKPTLTNISLSPKQGYENTLITFKVNYTDIDNHTASVASVFIDYYEYSMIKEDNLDNDYTDGCIYIFSIYLSPKSNNYTYWFRYSDDGLNSVFSVEYYDLKITQNPYSSDSSGGGSSDSKKSHSDEESELILPIIITVGSVAGIASIATIFYIKKHNIKLIKKREESIS
ncbi:MAG: C25 family cysteine peptidase [Candidatus Hermodarchaeota archaeon]